jgi:serine-type D-Ala-D-Ala carboxypeptidase (penicillin-binding protein 5/6)
VIARCVLLLLLAVCSTHAAAQQPAIAQAWLLVRDNEVLGAQRADARMQPASLAKLLTAVLWLQQGELLDQTVVASARAAAASGARAGLRAGASYRARDLLAAMLVRSGNDACLALAEQAAGSVEAFVTQMNRAAQLLELADSHFANPCGWDAPGQHSSARDLLKLARIAMEYPLIRELVALREVNFGAIDAAQPRRLASTNLLLERLPGTVGVKTGFTAKAGKCLIVLVEREGRSVWLVLLAAPDRWWTAHALIERAFRSADDSAAAR